MTKLENEKSKRKANTQHNQSQAFASDNYCRNEPKKGATESKALHSQGIFSKRTSLRLCRTINNLWCSYEPDTTRGFLYIYICIYVLDSLMDSDLVSIATKEESERAKKHQTEKKKKD